jgi:hypothetical protein
MTVPFGLGYEMTSLEKDRKLLRQDDSGAPHCESAPVLQQNAHSSPKPVNFASDDAVKRLTFALRGDLGAFRIRNAFTLNLLIVKLLYRKCGPASRSMSA